MAKSRAAAVARAGTWKPESAMDAVVLPHDGRHRRRVTMRTEGDMVFLLDLPDATRLMHGDGLVLDDGGIIAVVAADEPVAEIMASDPHHLARIAWHLGNRHLPTELLPDRLRIQPDPVIEDMVRGLGGNVIRREGRFEPEGGAYAGVHSHHDLHKAGYERPDHAHDHSCSHGHGDHTHSHDHHHGHKHDH